MFAYAFFTYPDLSKPIYYAIVQMTFNGPPNVFRWTANFLTQSTDFVSFSFFFSQLNEKAHAVRMHNSRGAL